MTTVPEVADRLSDIQDDIISKLEQSNYDDVAVIEEDVPLSVTICFRYRDVDFVMEVHPL